MTQIPSVVGLKDKPRKNVDIYALLEAPQELYFGLEPRIELNIIETVKVPAGASPDEHILKAYISPTKRRGIERRALLYMPINISGVTKTLGDIIECGIPHTCCKPECVVCNIFGGLIPKEEKSIQSRVYHGGGVAVQPIKPEEKIRTRVPSFFRKSLKTEETQEKQSQDEETMKNMINSIANRYGLKEREFMFPTPFRREYAQPGLVYPIYNHGILLDRTEIAAVYYAFLISHQMLGAGTPKGAGLLEAEWTHGGRSERGPALVIDEYLVPLGRRPIISPLELDPAVALNKFTSATNQVLIPEGYERSEGVEYTISVKLKNSNSEVFVRRIGNAAWEYIVSQASEFYKEIVSKVEELIKK